MSFFDAFAAIYTKSNDVSKISTANFSYSMLKVNRKYQPWESPGNLALLKKRICNRTDKRFLDLSISNEGGQKSLEFL